ncbi:isopenicillin N synthase family dioxygenase [Subtercola frigoramans]|uniref:Isopenicillin N synthase-like dioxygenase n=1 Tax=Subtercola frigoramans TaxID=120298 RepID=A0ABS2L3T8_9MICO|nr:isopenicillin N synthase family oxygenase [Subtercola frigoramans]MBM7471121.1 isopenicillin N synthase-like dioxygenase [Subtercola frigoramans]
MTTPTDTSLVELQKERRMGGEGTINTAREIRRIDLSDFEARRAEITEQLWAAAVDVGFFQIVNHGIDIAEVDRAFAMSAQFFALPEQVKQQYPLVKEHNAGWEFKSQVRPSIGVADQKESFQITRPFMDELWPSDAELEGFRATILGFEHRCWELAMQVLSCFADKLGFDRDFFTAAHNPESPNYQSTLRLLHYFAIPEEARNEAAPWRAGAHTDFDVLTLLFQREGQGGLQVLPGREIESEEWSPVVPTSDSITCNIGDMLMRWSDDVLPSNFHRVRGPKPGENQDARYSIAYFAQADRDVVMQSPSGAWESITAREFLLERIRANYAA